MILEVEQERADTANKERADLQTTNNILLGIQTTWIVGFILLIYHTYKKHDKELPSIMNTRYYRDFPASYGPEIVSYLFDKKIENKDLSASLLNLINKKVIKYEEIDKKKFMFIYDKKDIAVSSSETIILDWFFNDIGKDSKITIDDINKDAKTYDSILK